MNKPLEGLFVVELTTYWAAPSAGEFLRCLGARVVKIETGKAGDSVRYWGRTCGMPIEANENPSFDLFNGGKEFMHMDLNDPEHERVLHNMLAKADVFLTSMRLGGLKKHNLDYDTLKEKYPRLVMAHATGYGCKDGPLSAAPGLDAVAFFAMNGLISDLRLNPDDSPICPPTGMGDLTTGMPLFGAIMTALFARERTGKGDYVSASLYGTGNWVTSAINSGTQYFNPWPRSRFTQSPMGQAFETKDGKFVQIFVNEYERYFPVFCKAFNIEDMLDDERVNTRPALNVNGNCAIIVARCIEEAKKKTADEIMSVLQAGRAGASDEYVRLGEHVLHELEVLGIFQIQRDALFAAVENIVDGVLFRRDGHAHRAAVVTAEVADRRGLNAHDTRAHVAQEPRRRRRGPVAGHLDHEQSLEWFSHGYSLLVDADFF